MSRRAIGEGSGKAITPGEITLTHGPITKDFSLGAPPKGVPPPGTPKKTISPVPPPYLHHSDGGVPGGFDTGSGSHLSPLLFLICAEVVIRLAKKNLKGIRVGSRRFQVSAFADDTVLFLNGNKDLKK